MLIYKQYDQVSLDRQYNNRLQVPDYITYLERWDLLSRQTEKELRVIKDIAYGELLRERLDIYPSPLPQSKTLIFIHGGYWQRLDKADFQFIAKGFLPHHITTVLITYPLAPTVTMDQVVLSCQKAVHWLHQNLFSFNGDPHQMYIAGHSAGGHLAAMLMYTNWNELNLKPDLIKGVCAISGLYNLIPIWLSDINQVLKMDKEMVLRNSPVQLDTQLQYPLILAVGADESDEFKDQTREFYECWKEKTSALQFLELAGLNHYSILETIIEPTANLHQAVRQLLHF
jgi:arylformamidase